MSIKFGFSDECGSYSPIRSERQNQIHPFYLRSLFLMNGDDYKELTSKFMNLKNEFGLPQKEIKWSHIWSLRSCQNNNKVPNEKKDFYFLKDIDYHIIIDFVEKSLLLLKELESCKTVFTITDNKSDSKFSEKDLFKMHITSLLQRVQYETQVIPNDLTVLFFDPIGDKKSKLLRDTYFDIQTNGHFVKNYTHIKDSLNLEYSHHSTGIQIADYLAGVITGVLKSYDRSIEIFNKAVYPTLRNYNQKILGAGICEIPSNKNGRDKLRQTFRKHSS
ncbi:DUF3800 domain-containing protein [Psychroflexus sp. CAK1W]|uniref:DUF3800 domain-containing protein n=1 Tax=Psychroflexus curvus TaxID=2873595 RepID=UPI001CCD897F|nr:DUF3800 domain-containing protein [Psychroflexus curvus]MBZ9628141.1 DUF3800 domain-containing protein [Psychroflexus curvus]